MSYYKDGEEAPMSEISLEKRPFVSFPGLPLPPSSNNQYFLAKRGNKTYHIPSDELKSFKAKIEYYRLKNLIALAAKKGVIHGWLKSGHYLEVKSVFFFKEERIFCKNGDPKKMDCSNRIKALHDYLFKILVVDDSCIFKLSAEKGIAIHSNEESYVDIFPIE